MRIALLLAIGLLLCDAAKAEDARLQAVATKEAEAEEAMADIPNKWFQKAKGYEKAKALQAQTGADIFIYFTRDAPSNEKGLCDWFESRGLADVKVRKYLRNYIKVHVPLPSNPDSQKLAESFEARKSPAVFIEQPKGWRQHCKVFDWSSGRPELMNAAELIATFRTRSSDRYLTLE